MNKKLLIFQALLLLALSAISMVTHAQVRFRPGNIITVGNISPYDSYGLTMISDGVYFSCKGRNYLKMDFMPANPRIAGTGDQVVFYDTATSRFNSIQVKKVYNYSDARAKTNIKPINHALDILNQLRPVSYIFADEPFTLKARGTRYGEIGLLAQEVEEILPEVVATDEEGHKLINYDALIPLLIASVKSLSKEVEQLKDEVQTLKTRPHEK